MSGGRWATVGLVVAIAAGCSTGGNMRQSMGLAAPPPDEFLIVARQPLQPPPDFRSLPTPRPGTPSRVEPDPVTAAREALTGAPPPAAPASGPGVGEAALMAAAGATSADPAIREVIVAERPAPQRQFGLSSFLGVPIQQDPAAAADRLDPLDEAERLRSEGIDAPVAPPLDR